MRRARPGSRLAWLAAAPLGLGLLLAMGCAPGPAPDVEPEPPRDERPEEPGAGPAEGEPTGRLATERIVEGELPPIPRVTGPLALRVQYPERHRRLAVRDSNFIFGSVGTGDATLEIDGHPVPVEPNGAFLAFLPVPEPRRDTAVYRLVARRGAEADTLLHPVRVLPLPSVGPPGSIWLDTAARSEVERWTLADEPLELGIRGAPGLRVWADVGGERFLFEEGADPVAERIAAAAGPGAPAPPSRRYRARVPAGRLAAAAGVPPGRPARREPEPMKEGGPEASSALALVTPDTVELELVGAARGDTVRVERRLPLLVLDPDDLPVVTLREAPDTVNGTSGVVVGRPTPYGPYRWRFPPGARGLVDGRRDDRLRLRLAAHETAWVLAEDAEPQPPGTAPPTSLVGGLRIEPLADRLVLRVPLSVPLPLQVAEPEAGTLLLTLYGAEGGTDRVAYGERDPLLESVAWEQVAEGVYRVELRLREPMWGYRAAYEEGPSPALRFEIRRAPTIDPERPLRGRRIAVDPGHPGGGAHGPTGLYEGDANLAVARHLVELLRAEGAEPILIRADTLPLGLYERTERAVEAGAELFVSIHNNALPDGVRPFGREGTSTYYYHPHSRELAAAVQAGLLAEMGLRDLGIFWGDLAVARMSWMPSVLAEGAFMMIPRHEAGLRQPGFQARYARGVLRGIRDFLASRAEGREP